MNSKKIFTQLIAVMSLTAIAFGSFALASDGGGTIVVCPGTGVKCNVTVDNNQVISEKDKDKAAVILQ
jgi:hypothetical protein